MPHRRFKSSEKFSSLKAGSGHQIFKVSRKAQSLNESSEYRRRFKERSELQRLVSIPKIKGSWKAQGLKEHSGRASASNTSRRCFSSKAILSANSFFFTFINFSSAADVQLDTVKRMTIMSQNQLTTFEINSKKSQTIYRV